MRTERIVYTPEVILPIRRKENDNTSLKVKQSAKRTALLTAALIALAANARADVIKKKKIADEESRKIYDKYKPYDTNKDGILDEQEQIKMKREIKYKDIQNSLNLYSYEGEVRGNSAINKLNQEELIEFIQKYPKILYHQKLNADVSRMILNKLVDYRIKHLKKDFTPMDKFAEKAKMNDQWHVTDHIKRISKNEELKEVFADNFAFYYTDYKFRTDHYSTEYRNTFIELLLPKAKPSNTKIPQTSH